MENKLGWQQNRDWAAEAPNTWKHVHLAVLQDIRRELQTLNNIMRCQNVSKGFSALARIARRDQKAFKRRVDHAVAKRIKRAA